MTLFFPQCVKKAVLYISVYTPQGRDLAWRPDFVKQLGLSIGEMLKPPARRAPKLSSPRLDSEC